MQIFYNNNNNHNQIIHKYPQYKKEINKNAQENKQKPKIFLHIAISKTITNMITCNNNKL